ncbi:hypothetical protein JCM19294_151 [Nonlabens tegetincola]|uniref:Uncharacterized protein n=1 Tax=Nonlabens tegetincola TaxID=323273 RepID=A0A090Q3Q4_9FLAO|nr:MULTISPECIES: acetyltransferase [Nonlabens]MEE2801736.1 N-acetyltransferase [Bacteroidota bacterium]ALM22029.1 acetyltransferase [Nonlabens sp. MIC269]ARN71273.1 N-acetyltransferase [Nonlabens tegetincola]PQJ17149.1 N-acetyltransferase [Nonlabens tegetincola]GAK97615.1 hypothetical protein JCM19294_151 [Nonlabens tegetincola]
MSTKVNLEITDNEFLRQYECIVDGEMARIEYAQQDRKIFLTKLIIPEVLEENFSFKDEFLTAVFDNIKFEKELKVVPTHPKIAGFVRKNRIKYKEMLPVGIAI